MGRKIVIFIVVLLIVAVIAYWYTQYQKLANATWKYAGTRTNSLGLQTNSFTVYMTVENPGELGVTITEQNYKVYLNNDLIATVRHKMQSTIAPNSTSTIPLVLDIQMKDFLKAGINNIAALVSPDKSNVMITIKGHFNLKKGFLVVRELPFEQSITLKELLSNSGRKKE